MEISPEARKKKTGRRKKIRAATLIFDVIKRHSPQPVDDITDYNLCNLWFLSGEAASQIQTLVTTDEMIQLLGG